MTQANRIVTVVSCVFLDCINGSEKAGHYVSCQKCSKNAMNAYIVANIR